MYNSLYNRDDELYHIGKLGRSGRYKWGSGERPFQRLHERSVPELNARKNMYTAEGEFIKTLSNSIPERYTKPKKMSYKDFRLDKMTDDELKALSSRFKLENEYVTEMNKRIPQKQRGAEKVKEILAIAGSVTAVAASATAVALTIKQLKSITG